MGTARHADEVVTAGLWLLIVKGRGCPQESVFSEKSFNGLSTESGRMQTTQPWTEQGCGSLDRASVIRGSGGCMGPVVGLSLFLT